MTYLTLPNMLTVLRLALVPVVAYFIVSKQFQTALWIFLVAGITDAVDGALARKLNQRSQFGSWLDPAADKSLIVIILTLLAALGAVPLWLLLLVASRDLMIVAAIVDLYFRGKPPAFQPIMISKVNTLMQIVYLALVLAQQAALGIPVILVEWAGWLTAALTALSFLGYLRLWLRYRRQPARAVKSVN